MVTFISPCLLPMLPLYLAYFAGSDNAEAQQTEGKPGDKPSQGSSTARTVRNALGFILGFTVLFIAMGALAGFLGSFLVQYRTTINIVCGVVVIVFGLNFMGVFRIPLLQHTLKPKKAVHVNGFPSALLLGLVFAIGWTPCVGAFLGSALLLAAQQASMAHGIALLLCYSLGLGVPFLISAVIIDRLRGAFDFIKRHYQAINIACGALLVAIGLLMAFGLLSSWLPTLGTSWTGGLS